MSTELEQKWRAEFEAHSHPKLHRSWQYMTTFERECQLSLMETYWTYYLAACERRHAEAEALREQLRQCRVYLRNRLQMQNQRKENEALRAENARLREALEKAIAALIMAEHDVADWGCYASQYFQDKHRLDDDVKFYKAEAIAAAKALRGGEGV